jgi:hypothetical protein
VRLGDPFAGLKSPVEEMAGEGGHGGVEFGVSDAALGCQDGVFGELPFGVAAQEDPKSWVYSMAKEPRAEEVTD